MQVINTSARSSHTAHTWLDLVSYRMPHCNFPNDFFAWVAPPSKNMSPTSISSGCTWVYTYMGYAVDTYSLGPPESIGSAPNLWTIGGLYCIVHKRAVIYYGILRDGFADSEKDTCSDQILIMCKQINTSLCTVRVCTAVHFVYSYNVNLQSNAQLFIVYCLEWSFQTGHNEEVRLTLRTLDGAQSGLNSRPELC